jgi:hypothetical protein
MAKDHGEGWWQAVLDLPNVAWLAKAHYDEAICDD